MLMAENSVNRSLYKVRLAMYNVQEVNLMIKNIIKKYLITKLTILMFKMHADFGIVPSGQFSFCIHCFSK